MVLIYICHNDIFFWNEKLNRKLRIRFQLSQTEKNTFSVRIYQSLVYSYWLLLLFSFRNTRNVDKKKNTVHKSDKIFQEYWIFLSRKHRRVCWSKFFLFFPPQISFVLRARVCFSMRAVYSSNWNLNSKCIISFLCGLRYWLLGRVQ